MAKPTYEQLIAYASGNLPADLIESVAATLRTDPSAAAVVNQWRLVHRLVAGDDSVEPSAAALLRAKAVFERHSSATAGGATIASWTSAVDRLIARVIYNSRLQPETVRHADADDRILLTLELDDGEVDLQALRIAGSGRWRIIGQIAGSNCAARDVALIGHGSAQPAGNAISDDRGAFALEAPAGEYELLIRRGEGAVVLAPLSLS